MLTWSRRLCFLALLGALLWLGFRLTHAPALTVREARVSGVSAASGLSEVRRALAPALGRNILTLDLSELDRSLRGLSWVKRASLRRGWPDAVIVDIERYRAVAIWEDGRLVSREGTLFQSYDETIAGLAEMPLLAGDPEALPRAVESLEPFQREAERAGGRVKSLRVSFRGSWSVTMELPRCPSLTVELGRPLAGIALPEKLALVLRHYDEVSAVMNGYPRRVDARYRDAFAAQRPDAEGRERWRRDNPKSAAGAG